MSETKRIEWIDIAKGLTMVFVVLGHTLREGFVHNVVYSFHVPCFFFLSGMVTNDELSIKEVCKDANRILIPYYFWGLVSIAIYGVLGSVAAASFNMNTDSIWENIGKLLYGYSILSFNAPLWFLPALFATKIIYKFIYKLSGGDNCRMICLTVLGSLISFCYTNLDLVGLPFSFDLVLKLFPFFLAGKLVIPRINGIWKAPQCKRKHIICGLMMLVAVCALGGAFVLL